MARGLYVSLSITYFVLGLIFLVNSASPLTGLAITETVPPSSSALFGIAFFAGAWWMLLIANRQKKGQAAMEFMETYGWAVLATIVAIGGLMYVLLTADTSSELPLLSPPFVSQGIELQGTDVILEIKNSGGIDTTIQQITLGNCIEPVNTLLRSDDTTTIAIDNCNPLPGAKLVIKYLLPQSTLTQYSWATLGNIIGGSGTGSGLGWFAVCGNGDLEGNEECDDGNINNGDGCDDGCEIESGWSCVEVNDASVCTLNTICGNGGICIADGDCDSPIETCASGNCVEPSEECDDGNTSPGDGCSATCTIEESYECNDGEDNDGDGLIDLEDLNCGGDPTGIEANTCGDGVIEFPETCDDANPESGDGCSAVCIIEEGYICTGEPSSCILAKCNNSIDDDGDEKTDYPADKQCINISDNDESK